MDSVSSIVDHPNKSSNMIVSQNTDQDTIYSLCDSSSSDSDLINQEKDEQSCDSVGIDDQETSMDISKDERKTSEDIENHDSIISSENTLVLDQDEINDENNNEIDTNTDDNENLPSSLTSPVIDNDNNHIENSEEVSRNHSELENPSLTSKETNDNLVNQKANESSNNHHSTSETETSIDIDLPNTSNDSLNNVNSPTSETEPVQSPSSPSPSSTPTRSQAQLAADDLFRRFDFTDRGHVEYDQDRRCVFRSSCIKTGTFLVSEYEIVLFNDVLIIAKPKEAKRGENKDPKTRLATCGLNVRQIISLESLYIEKPQKSTGKYSSLEMKYKPYNSNMKSSSNTSSEFEKVIVGFGSVQLREMWVAVLERTLSTYNNRTDSHIYIRGSIFSAIAEGDIEEVTHYLNNLNNSNNLPISSNNLKSGKTQSNTDNLGNVDGDKDNDEKSQDNPKGGVNTVDVHGNSLLVLSLLYNHLNIASLLIKHNADINARVYLHSNSTNSTVNNSLNPTVQPTNPESSETKSKDTNLVLSLIIPSNSSSVSGSNSNSSSAYDKPRYTRLIHHACETLNFNFIKLLLTKGVDVQVLDSQSHFPLELALNKVLPGFSTNESYDLDALPLSDSKSNTSTDSGESTTSEISQSNSTQDHSGIHSPIDIISIESQSVESMYKRVGDILHLFVSHSRDFNFTDKKGRSILMHAAHHNNTYITTVLLNFSHTVSDISTEHGLSALHYAIKAGSLDCARLLLQHGARVNSRDYRGNTPLHLATSIAAVELLVSHGARTALKNMYKREAIEQFKQGGDMTEVNDTVAKETLRWNRALIQGRDARQDEWVPNTDSELCYLCCEAFTFFNRRHHCRRCGVLVCGPCSRKTYNKDRLCDCCFNELRYKLTRARDVRYTSQADSDFNPFKNTSSESDSENHRLMTENANLAQRRGERVNELGEQIGVLQAKAFNFKSMTNKLRRT